MKTEIGIIGHADHGKTTLAAAMMHHMKETKAEIVLAQETLQESIERDSAFQITAPELHPSIGEIKSGKQSRRERRARERMSNKKKS